MDNHMDGPIAVVRRADDVNEDAMINLETGLTGETVLPDKDSIARMRAVLACLPAVP